MQARFLLGPAGSGKTFRCLAEIRAALRSASDGPPLILLAPKQATFQLERQLLADPALPGYTRLQILSFDRLAEFVLSQFHQGATNRVSEEGRVMVLRALLAQHREQLHLFRASARLPGFAQQLSRLLREFQCCRHTPSRLDTVAAKVGADTPLGGKLRDLAFLMRAYLSWLKARGLGDADGLLDEAVATLLRAGSPDWAGRADDLPGSVPPEPGQLLLPGVGLPAGFHLGDLWLDGFAEMTPQELGLVAALLPLATRATLAFCIREVPRQEPGWLSIWSPVARTFRRCYQQAQAIPGCELSTEVLEGEPKRFADNPVLAHLANSWADPQPFSADVQSSLRAVLCANPEAEAVLAARELLRWARGGGRFRDCAVLLRQFQGYHDPVRRVFTRYGIPFFLDRREPVSHHPLAELSRYAVRLIAFDWQHDDWFGALKTGLTPADETAIDRLENEALARGWSGEQWLHPLVDPERPNGLAGLEGLRQHLVPPFQRFKATLGDLESRPTGPQLAEALRALWQDLRLDQVLQTWSQSASTTHPRAACAVPAPVHLTVWQQMHDWLDNLALAFPDLRLSLPEWLAILEAGLAGLTVGVIPPALDQVLIGTIDRSRNPDLQLALVLGLNEGVFPARPTMADLLSETDRRQLQSQGMELSPDSRAQLGQEQYYGYIAFTRPRRRLVVTCARRDEQDKTLNPSSFLGRLQRLFPSLQLEDFDGTLDWSASEHPCELVAPLIQASAIGSASVSDFLALPAFASLGEQLNQGRAAALSQSLSPAVAEQLYGSILSLSVTSLEEFAACPFKFFIGTGLRAEDRQRFQLDVLEEGSFQHQVLAAFHQQLLSEHLKWRDLTPVHARERMQAVAAQVSRQFRSGLLLATPQHEFTTQELIAGLQDFIEIIIGWMAQYQFDPTAVELGFGLADGGLPGWELDLGQGHKLLIRGKIDRLDLCQPSAEEETRCIVIDYKSGQRQLDSVLLEHGVQLQLPVYLNLLRHLADPATCFGVGKLIPVGMFYASLRGQFPRGGSRDEVLPNLDLTQQTAYQHTGRFDVAALRQLDHRTEATAGSQFKYRLKQDGALHGASPDAMPTADFRQLLDQAEKLVCQIGSDIFAGTATVDPYQKGNRRPCDQCNFQAICRLDPWSHPYRVLR